MGTAKFLVSWSKATWTVRLDGTEPPSVLAGKQATPTQDGAGGDHGLVSTTPHNNAAVKKQELPP